MSNELKKTEQPLTPAAASPAQLMQMAATGAIDPAMLREMMELQRDWEANEAKKAYVKAMAAFKADPPKIYKDKTVDYTSSKGRTVYDHASLANVTESINGKLAEHGLSSSWSTDQKEGGAIFVTCTITHEQGHSESTTLSSLPDPSGGKNSIQAIGSTVSYLQRYTLLAMTGLAAHDMDNDANTPDLVTPEQVAELEAAIGLKKINREKFLAYLRVNELSELYACNFKRAVNAIAAAKGEA